MTKSPWRGLWTKVGLRAFVVAPLVFGSTLSFGETIRPNVPADTSTRITKARLAELSVPGRSVLQSLGTAVGPRRSSVPRVAGEVPTASGLTEWKPQVTLGLDGNVLSMARLGGTLYLAGPFRSIGTVTGGFASLNPQTGESVPSLLNVAGGIYRLVDDGAGGWFVGGSFSAINGVARKNLAHILPDGAVDASWDPAVEVEPGDYGSATVASLLMSGSKLFVAGDFRRVGGQRRVGLACVDVKTGQVLPSQLDLESYPAGFYGDGHCLAAGGGLVFVSGYFLSIGGMPRYGLAAFDPTTCSVTDWSIAGLGVDIFRMEYRNGALWIAGSFGVLAPEGLRRGIAAIDVQTRTLLPFNARVAGIEVRFFQPLTVNDFCFVNDSLYVSGNFTSIGGAVRTSLAVLDPVTGDALDWVPPTLGPDYGGLPPPGVWQMRAKGDTLFIAGGFDHVGGQDRYLLAAIRRSTGEPLAWNPRPNNSAIFLGDRNGALLVGGDFSSIGDWRHRAGLAAVDLATGLLKPWNPNPNGAVVSQIVAYRDRIIAVGDFTSIGGNPEPRRFLAALDTLNGELLPWQVDMDGVPEQMALNGNVLYMSGSFHTVNGETRAGLAAVDAGGAADLLWWAPTVNSAVLTMLVRDSTLYLGGMFTAVNGVPRNGAAGVALEHGELRPWNPSPDLPLVESLCDGGDRIYLGGAFSALQGEPRSSLGSVDPATGTVLPWHPLAEEWNTLDPRVRALAMSGDRLVVGGDFSVIGGKPRICLAALDTATAIADEWDPSTDGLVWSLLKDGPNLIVGGGFGRIGVQPASCLAAFRHGARGTADAQASRMASFLPNPASSSTVVRFNLPAEAVVSLVVYDIQGRRIAMPLQGVVLAAGAHGHVLDVRQWRAGVYLCRLTVDGRSSSRKLFVSR